MRERLPTGPDREAYRVAAADYEAWAADPHPDDEVSGATLLVSAGEALGFAEDFEGALELFERAIRDGGAVWPDARCYRVGALLNLGRHDEADAATTELMRSRPRDPFVYQYVGQQYEFVDRLDEANRWMTAGVVRLLRTEDAAAPSVLMLMASRRRVRQKIGFDEDEFDVLAQPQG